MNIYRIIGAFGLLFIITGVLVKKDNLKNIVFIIGGLCLGAYSFYIEDIFFVTLQFVFVLAAIYNLIKNKIKQRTA